MSRSIGCTLIRALCVTLILLAAWALSGTVVPAAAASTITVSTCNDSSVQNAIDSASAGDTINFSCSGTITLDVTNYYEFLIPKDLTIDGAGQSVTFDGNGQASTFNVAQTASLTVKNLTFTNGLGGTFSRCIGCENVDFGGAITAEGPLTVENCTFSNNTNPGTLGGGAILAEVTTLTVSDSTFNGNSAAARGAGILSGASILKVTDSTFSNNAISVEGEGGGIDVNGGNATISGSTFYHNTGGSFDGVGAGIANTGATTTITNSTFSGNSALAGGAIANSGTLTVIDSTLAGNHATWWGNGILNGIVEEGASLALGGTVTITNSILANGPAGDDLSGYPTGGNCVSNGTINSGGGSFDDDGTCDVDQVATADLKLGSLADNGGPTQTIALGSDSVAIDADACIASVPTDQRGYTRPTGNTCDAGAYEFGAVNPIKSTSMSNVSGSGPYGGTATLTATLTSSGTDVSGVSVSFTLNGTPAGSATTNSSGVASLDKVSLAGISAGSHPNYVGASFAGNSSYSSSSGSGTLTVSNAGQTITVGTPAPASATFNTSFTVTATADSGLTVSYGSSGACSNDGAIFTITSGTGTCTVSFSQAGDANYDAAPTVTETVTAMKADQAISFDLSTLPAKAYADSAFDISSYASASSGLPLSFASQTTSVCTVSGTSVTIITSGKCTITASQGGNDNYAAADDVQQSFTIAKAVLTITADNQSVAYHQPIPDLTYTATGFVNGDDQRALSGAPKLSTTATQGSDVGTYPITISAGTLSAANYTFTFKSGALTITQASQTITFAALPDVTYGAKPFTLSASASSTLPVTFSISSGSACTLANTTLTITGAGSCSVTATQAGNTNYQAAPSVTRSFTINRAPLVITANDQTMPYGGTVPVFTVSYHSFVNGDTASVVSGLTCSALDDSHQPVSSSTHAGNYAITCSGASAANYTISYVQGTLTITKLTPVLTWATPEAIRYGTPLSVIQLDASANVDGSFSYNPTAGTFLNAGTGQTLSVTFTPTDTSDYTSATKRVTIDVTPAPLTITATDQTMTVGGSLPSLSSTASGWVNGDSSASLTTPPNCTTTATASSPVGTYPITCTGAVDDNYTISYQPGTLSVAYGVSLANHQSSITVTRGYYAVIELEVENANGKNLSSRSLKVTAENLAPAGQSWDGENGNFVHQLQYGSSVYRLTINSRSLSPGDYTLSYTISGDPTIHTVTITASS